MMDEKVRRDLSKTELPGCYDRLVRFVTRFDYSVGSVHPNREKARADHDGKEVPCILII